jgi:hypothetical protein
MGRMLVEGLRRATWRTETAAPWLSQAEVDQEVLPRFNPLKTETPINPLLLLGATPLGENGLPGLRLYHHPSCFVTTSTRSAQARARDLARHLEDLKPTTPPSSAPLLLEENIKGAAHHLDATYSCSRKYWLEHVKGWPTEPFRLPNTAAEPSAPSAWPEPTTFGLMMHRVLEIGLRNPCQFGETTPPLDASWQHKSDVDLASSDTVGRVMNEFGFGLEQDADSREAAWRDRLMVLSSLVDQGLLGRWVQGEAVNGWTVEAVRTELPFYHREVLTKRASTGSEGAIYAQSNGASVQQVNMDFNGRADLVLALMDEKGRGALQVVDLKTRGCLGAFNQDEPAKGHPLQAVPPSEVDPVPQSDEEANILHEHRLQLALYSMALEAIEAKKPASEQRRILPPALLLGANGRMVQLSQGAFEQAKKDLRAHLNWRVSVHLDPHMEEPARLPSGAETCRQCPFYRGDLRRCGPEGEPLGFIHQMDAER